MALPNDWFTRCHNAEPGTFGHECGKPAQWVSDFPSKIEPGTTYTSSFCDDCKNNGWERKGAIAWRRIG
jgi:hypothetical protein